MRGHRASFLFLVGSVRERQRYLRDDLRRPVHHVDLNSLGKPQGETSCLEQNEQTLLLVDFNQK